MKRVKYLLAIFILIAISSCEEEKYFSIVPPSIHISEPMSNFIVQEYEYVFVRVDIDVPEYEVNKIEFKYWAHDLFDEPENKIIEEGPFEINLYIPKSCAEQTYLFITAKLYLQSGKTVDSDTVWGYVTKNLPSNNEMDIYDYEAYDSDSILVAEGILTIVRGYYPPGFNDNILGRRDINYISGDSTFEKGKGFLEGHIKQNNFFYIKLTPCELTGLQEMGIVGEWDNAETLEGERYFYPDHSPFGIKLGTFRAIKRN